MVWRESPHQKGKHTEMQTFRLTPLRLLLLLGLALLARPARTFAQTDEIQVYDAEIEDVGKFNVMVHNNFTPVGRKEADFPGGIIPIIPTMAPSNGLTA